MDLEVFTKAINEVLSNYGIEHLNRLEDMILEEGIYRYKYSQNDLGIIYESKRDLSWTYRMLLMREGSDGFGSRSYSESEVRNLVRFYENQDLIKKNLEKRFGRRVFFHVGEDRNGYELEIYYTPVTEIL